MLKRVHFDDLSHGDRIVVSGNSSKYGGHFVRFEKVMDEYYLVLCVQGNGLVQYIPTNQIETVVQIRKSKKSD